MEPCLSGEVQNLHKLLVMQLALSLLDCLLNDLAAR